MYYKYNYALSSKRNIFLWLYQVLPNIDIIKYIYKLKEEVELYDIHYYYRILPPSVGTFKEYSICNLKKYGLRYPIRFNILFMKLIQEPGFICSFVFNECDYDEIELIEINNSNWISVIPSINYNPPLQEKIKIINKIYNNTWLLTSELEDKLEGLYYWFKHTYGHNIFRIGYDQHDNVYIPYFDSLNTTPT